MHYNEVRGDFKAAIQIVFSEVLDYWMTQLLNKFGKTDDRQSVDLYFFCLRNSSFVCVQI